jgi:anhydro-N-acetylmuramic acid kinase
MDKNNFLVIGCMSGTSLDGLDLVLCRLWYDEFCRWQYLILMSYTEVYDNIWRERLRNARHSSAWEYAMLHRDFGCFTAKTIQRFLSTVALPYLPDLIASHGHTVFHVPEQGLTTQIGSGAEIAAGTDIPTICDFRSTDVAIGGQGAPLVPIGDDLLFDKYAACLNLGGIANISYRDNEHRKAFDIAPCNMIFNYLAIKEGHLYDRDGLLARDGILSPSLFKSWETLPYYEQKGAKSLGAEWFENTFLPCLSQENIPVSHAARTAVEHVASRVAAALEPVPGQNILVTGGGAKNKFLMERLSALSSKNFEIPDPKLVDYKEALVFAFLGLLRWKGKINCLHSVTGAPANTIGGAVYLPPKTH